MGQDYASTPLALAYGEKGGARVQTWPELECVFAQNGSMDEVTLAAFLDDKGRLKAWPSRKRRSDQILALQYLATKLEPGKTYHEVEMNALLKSWHTFSDWALLRRELFEIGLVGRTLDGRSYWLVDQSGEIGGLSSSSVEP